MLHEKLICYRKALKLAEEMNNALSRWPRGYGYLSDQVKRALASVVLNCAEGNARTGKKERKRFFLMARASLAEVGASLDLMKAFRLIADLDHHRWRSTSIEISKILFVLK